MSLMRKKITKLIKNPKFFLLDFILNLNNNFYLNFVKNKEDKVFFVFHVAHWKRDFLKKCFPSHKLIFISNKCNFEKYERFVVNGMNFQFLVWGVNLPEKVNIFAKRYGVDIFYLEDGFVRSVGLGALHVLPHSICLDERGIYFNARQESDLEVLLETENFSSNQALMDEARECLDLILKNGITKYNLPETNLAPGLYGEKKRPRILVIGQVENDQSILYGCEKVINNNDVVRLAHQENPDAQIIYKVHPDVLAAKRKELSNPLEVADIAVLVRENMSLTDALHEVDKVYTISSLAGFESLLRGVPVVTVGCPFYAGWGLTDSRQVNPRRTRTLTLEELFAGAYLMYPKYFDPDTGRPSTLKETIHRFSMLMAA